MEEDGEEEEEAVTGVSREHQVVQSQVNERYLWKGGVLSVLLLSTLLLHFRFIFPFALLLLLDNAIDGDSLDTLPTVRHHRSAPPTCPASFSQLRWLL